MNEAKEAAKQKTKVARRAREKAKHDAQHNECKQAISQWQKSTLQNLQHSRNSLLPLDVWTKILKSFCDDMELEGVRGPSVIARELSLVARVNKELYASSQPAFQYLSNLCPSIDSMVHKLELRREHSTRRPRPIPDSSQWSAIVSDPKSLSSAELISLCLALNLIFSRPKDVLILELMKSMSLKHPTPTPARLVLAVQCERRDHLHDVDQKDKLLDSLRRAKGESLGKYYQNYKLFDFRRECSALHVSTTKALEAAAAIADRH